MLAGAASDETRGCSTAPQQAVSVQEARNGRRAATVHQGPVIEMDIDGYSLTRFRELGEKRAPGHVVEQTGSSLRSEQISPAYRAKQRCTAHGGDCGREPQGR